MSQHLYKLEFCCMMSFVSFKESLIIWYFKENFLNKETKNFSELKVTVSIAEIIGQHLGKLLTNSLAIFAKPCITASQKPLRYFFLQISCKS